MKEGGDLDDTIKASRKKTKNEGNLGISAILFLKKKTRAQDRHQPIRSSLKLFKRRVLILSWIGIPCRVLDSATNKVMFTCLT